MPALARPHRTQALVPRRECRFEPIRRAVESRAGRQFRGFRIEVVPGLGLVLHGEAASFHAKQLAQHVVAHVTGQAILANRIAVRPPARP